MCVSTIRVKVINLRVSRWLPSVVSSYIQHPPRSVTDESREESVMSVF